MTRKRGEIVRWKEAGISDRMEGQVGSQGRRDRGGGKDFRQWVEA